MVPGWCSGAIGRGACATAAHYQWAISAVAQRAIAMARLPGFGEGDGRFRGVAVMAFTDEEGVRSRSGAEHPQHAHRCSPGLI
jgi:hypothetical protein